MQLLDTNIVIYLQKGLLAENLPAGDYAISVITEMELRSASALTTEEQAWLMQFIQDVKVLDITTAVKESAIKIRQSRKVKLPDAIVAATAITNRAELVTNDKGLQSIEGVMAREVKIINA